ncbi:hypothetical protein [Columbia Basin potato purple top phytoplasma]|uniref:hypothetical protein n=1 Tax=Columbia Basin potato purple top phytoplasma TaxID=307134 RepID=UPI003CC7EE85
MTKINKSIHNKEFFTNKAFVKSIEYAKKNNSKIHLLGWVFQQIAAFIFRI